MVDPARIADDLADVIGSSDVPGATWTVSWGAGPDRRTVVDAVDAETDAIVRIASLTKPVAAVATLALAERGVLRLDDPVGRWLPELEGRRVLRAPDAELDDTEPAQRGLDVHDLLVMGLGLGFDPRLQGEEPIAREVAARDLGPRHDTPALDDEGWLRAVGDLPMLHQPGQGWLYDTSYVALGILLSRAAGRPLADVLVDTVLDPLGMQETGRRVGADALDRVPALVLGQAPHVASPAADPDLLVEPRLQSASTGLVSTVEDLGRFWRAVLDHEPSVLSEAGWNLLGSDHLSPAQDAMARTFLAEHEGWGYGGTVDRTPAYPGSGPGRYGWAGGTGTFAAADRASGVSAVLLTQRGLDGPDAERLWTTFWTAVHA